MKNQKYQTITPPRLRKILKNNKDTYNCSFVTLGKKVNRLGSHAPTFSRTGQLTDETLTRKTISGWLEPLFYLKQERKFLLRNFDLLKPVRDEAIFIADTFFVLFFSRANWALLTLKRQHLRKQILFLKKASHFIFGWRHRGTEFVAGQVRIP